jgi:hypothetical protein
MKINSRYQDQHTGEGGVDWVAVQKVERDICLLYHQLSNYRFIMGDLYYGSVYGLPYWDYLELDSLDQREREFVRDGCLVMMLAMCWDQIDGSGNYIGQHIPACRAALLRLIPYDDDAEKLMRTVGLALNLVANGAPVTEELGDLSGWVHEKYVKGYFREIAREFDATR